LRCVTLSPTKSERLFDCASVWAGRISGAAAAVAA
jgi:hypothetical protein